MKRFTIFVFGSDILPEDKIAWDVANHIVKNKLAKNFEFILSNNPEEIIEFKEKHIFILDVVKGIKDICIIDDIERLEERNINTLHDFGLSFYLKLLKEIKEINKITIVGIPYGSKKEIDKLSRDVIKVLNKYIENIKE